MLVAWGVAVCLRLLVLFRVVGGFGLFGVFWFVVVCLLFFVWLDLACWLVVAILVFTLFYLLLAVIYLIVLVCLVLFVGNDAAGSYRSICLTLCWFSS